MENQPTNPINPTELYPSNQITEEHFYTDPNPDPSEIIPTSTTIPNKIDLIDETQAQKITCFEQDLSAYLQKLKGDIPIESVFALLGVTSFNTNNQVQCIFHQDKNPSLTIYPDEQRFHCFGCKAGGDMFDAIGLAYGCQGSVWEQLLLLGELMGKDYAEPFRKNIDPSMIPERQVSFQEKLAYTKILEEAFRYFNQCIKNPRHKKALDYVIERFSPMFSEEFILQKIDEDLIGFNDGLVLHYLIHEMGFKREDVLKTGLFKIMPGSTTAKDLFKNRIMFPYWHHKKITYAIGRSLGGVTKDYVIKYKKLLVRNENHPYSCAENTLFNADSVNSTTNYFLIAEGIIEGYMCRWLNIPYVSPITKQFAHKDKQRLAKLASTVEQVFIIPDNEESKEGEKGALSSARTLVDTGKDIRVVILPRPDGQDKVDLMDYFKELVLPHVEDEALNRKARARSRIAKIEKGIPLNPEDIEPTPVEVVTARKMRDEQFSNMMIENLMELCYSALDYIEYLIDKIPPKTKTQTALSMMTEVFNILGTRKDCSIDLYLNQIRKKVPLMSKLDLKKKIRSSQLSQSKQSDDHFSRQGYKIIDNCFYRDVKTPDGITEKKISNFHCYIQKEVTYDNGDDADKNKLLHGVYIDEFGDKKTFKLTAGDISSDTRLREKLISQCGVRTWIDVKEERHVCNAMSLYSHAEGKSVTQKIIYGHTGWLQDKSVYIYPGYSLDRDGHDVSDAISVELNPRFSRVMFSKLSRNDIYETMLEGVVRGLLKSTTYDITLPCIATTFLPPIFPYLAINKRYMLWLYGTTGKGKTTLATLCSSFYGDFTEENPMDTWKSSPGSIERCGYELKDAVYTIDEYRNSITTSQHKALIQNYADQTAKGRLNSNARLRQSYPIRSFIIATGEDLPTSEASVLARLYPLEFNESGSLEKIDIAKKYAHNFRGIIPDFIRYFRSNYDEKELYDQSIVIRQACLKDVRRIYSENAYLLEDPSSNIGRITTNTALCFIGYHYFINYIKYLKLPAADIVEIEEAYKAKFDSFIVKYANQVIQESPGHLFLSTLKDLINSGKLYILKNGEEPELNQKGTLVGITRLQRLQGGVTKEHVFINPSVAYGEVQRTLSERVAFSPNAIWKQLAEKGLLVPATDGRLLTNLTMEDGRMVNMLCFRNDVFYDSSLGKRPDNVINLYETVENEKDLGEPEEVFDDFRF